MVSQNCRQSVTPAFSVSASSPTTGTDTACCTALPLRKSVSRQNLCW